VAAGAMPRKSSSRQPASRHSIVDGHDDRSEAFGRTRREWPPRIAGHSGCLMYSLWRPSYLPWTSTQLMTN
jgi:hypothetical protein